MTRERLSAVDTAWLRLEDPAHPMMITILMVFSAPIDFEQLRAIVQGRLLCHPRFQQRVVQPGQAWDPPYWQVDSDFDLDFHLKRTSLAPTAGPSTLQDIVSELMSTQLDISRPLWQFHLVRTCDQGCALVGRVHHCLADGPALMHVLLDLTDGAPHASRSTASREPRPTQMGPDWGIAARITQMLTRQGLEYFYNPFRLLRLPRLGTATAAALTKLMTRAHDPETVFKGELGIAKRAAWSAPIRLEEVKAVGRAVDGTVNDVMLATATGALRRYMQSCGQPTEGVNLRAGLSVNLRASSVRPQLGNKAGAVLVSLPVGIATPMERLSTVKKRMDALKDSPEGTMVFALLNALGSASPAIQDSLVDTYLSRDTAVAANVPGPTETIYLAGAPLETLLFWVPALGRVGLSLNIISYAGHIRLGVATDRGLVPDPEQIVAGFHTEFDELRRQVAPVTPQLSIEAMSAMLDAAIRTLDDISEKSGKSVRPKQL
jgi:diacylglycerol O-acyltransferase